MRVGLLDADIYGPSIPKMMNLGGQPELTKGWSSVIIMIWIKACFSYLHPQCCSWTKSCYCWKTSDLNCTPNGSSCAFCIKRGHLENKVDVYDQRNDCNLNLDPEMTIVAHDILVHNIWLNFLKILNIWKLIPLTCKVLREIFKEYQFELTCVFYLSKENMMKPLVNFGVPW